MRFRRTHATALPTKTVQVAARLEAVATRMEDLIARIEVQVAKEKK